MGISDLEYSIKKLDLTAWLDKVKNFNDYSYTRYWEYSMKAAERVNASSENIAVYDCNNKIISLVNIRIRKLPFGLGGLAYINDGPMIDQGQKDTHHALNTSLSALKNEYVRRRGLVLRVSQRHKLDVFCDEEVKTYQKNGFAKVGDTNATMIIDLTQNLDEIRKGFHQKWRNILNKSEKQDIKIISGYDNNLFDDFSELFDDLLVRKSFKVNMDDKFFASIQNNSNLEERFYLAIAYKDGKAISGHLSSICGDTSIYILGATNDLGRTSGASYLLQWHAIKESKKHNCRWYDLGGVERESNPNVYQFKKRMRGEETKLGNVFQYKNGAKATITLFLEKSYKLIRN